ncbi:MAG: hypothetical protein HRU22_11760 [Gammaproteobacteria bacterium]|nr:hypothetical protein [Gammaproteobacteria bacterium]
MKILNYILIALIALLSIAAGAAKVMELPQEVQFLQSFGFSSLLIITYGLVQIAGGGLLAFPKTLKWGAIIIILAFALSTVLIFVGGNFVFGLASMLPIIIAGIILWLSRKVTHNE